MAARVRHSKVVTIPDDPNYPVGSSEWNDDHVITGLENVDNTSDASKPVSTAQAAADAAVAANAANASNLTSGTVPAARLPNPSAATLGGIQSVAPVSHNWINSISTAGVPTQAQPAASDISGLAPSATTDTTNANNITGGSQTGTGAMVRATAIDHLVAVDYGVDGLGGDQTAALAAAVAALPATGGNILLSGTVSITSLDLHGKRNIRFIGQGGNGAGASQRTILTTAVGAGGARIIDARNTDSVSFERLFLQASNAAFDGTLIDYGVISNPGSSNMALDDCVVNVVGAAGTGLSLYGATEGSFNRTSFIGAGKLVALQLVGGVNFCNVHTFRACNFKPTNQYPIVGSGDAISFIGCNWQAGSSDGKARALQSSTSARLRGLTLKGCGFYDITASGTIWFSLAWGGGLDVRGCMMGGIAGSYGFDMGGIVDADPENSGWGGVLLSGNYFDTLTAVMVFEGTSANGSNVRGVVATGNRLVNTTLFSGVAAASAVFSMGNRVYGVSGGADEIMTAYGAGITAPSINKIAITAPATSATLTIPDGVTLTGPAASGTAMTLGNSETVSGVKTFSVAPIFNGGIRTSGPVTSTLNYTMVSTDTTIIFNAATPANLTLLSAASNAGRWVIIKTIAAQSVSSVSSNVVPLVGGAAGTAVLAGTAGKWVALQSDGTNWVAMMGN